MHILLDTKFLPVYKGEEVTGMLRRKLDLHERKRLFIHVRITLIKIFIHSHNLCLKAIFCYQKRKLTTVFFLLKELGLGFFFFPLCDVLFIKVSMDRLELVEFCQIWIHGNDPIASPVHTVSASQITTDE